MSNFSNFIGPKINDELANKYLKALILQRCEGNIEKARSDVAVMGKFVKNLAENLGKFPSSFTVLLKQFTSSFIYLHMIMKFNFS